MRRILIALIAAWLVTSAPAQEVDAVKPAGAETPSAPVRTTIALTLEQAFARALDSNPAVLRANEEIGAAIAVKKGTLASILPHLTLTGSTTRNDREVSFGSGADRRTILAQNDWNYRFTLTQPVYAGNRERRAYEQTKIGVKNAGQGVEAAREQILIRVALDYLAVVEGDALIEVEKQYVDLAAKRMRQASDFYEAGEVTKVDVLRAESALSAAQRRLTAARQARGTAAGRVRIDLNLEGEVKVVDPKLDAGALPSESELIARAEANRPDLVLARNLVDVARLEVRKQRGKYLPVVAASATWVEQAAGFPSSSYGQASLNFTVPIYQSGEVGAAVTAAKHRLREAELSLDEARQSVREDVRKALLDLDSSQKSLALANQQLAASSEEYRQIYEMYRAQEATSLDVDLAESSLGEARRAVVASGIDRALASLRVWYATGSLEDVVIRKEKP